MFLAYVLFQHPSHIQQLLRIFDSNLGVELKQKSYAEKCDFTPRNIYDSLDFFFFHHAICWCINMLITRDRRLCYLKSVLFELIEMSLQHQLPNFAECWWDRWILDVALMNTLGIELGYYLCQRWGYEMYNWLEIPDKSSINTRKRIESNVVNYSGNQQQRKNSRMLQISSVLNITNWTMNGYMGFTVVLVVGLVYETVFFYMQDQFWIPVGHPVILFRNFILIPMIVVPLVPEFYNYVTGSSPARSHIWMIISFTCAVMEVLMSFKFGIEKYTRSPPSLSVLIWQMILLIWLLYPSYILLKNSASPKTFIYFKRYLSLKADIKE